MALYPISLCIEGKKCVVIGGGKVAERKVRTLCQFQARVKVIAPRATAYLRKLAVQRKIEYKSKRYSAGDLAGVLLVIGATDNRNINQQVSQAARQKGLLVNIVDDPELSNFFVPACVRRGDLTISIATAGKSPALARDIRKQLEKIYGPEYAGLLKLLGGLRQQVKTRYADPQTKKRLWQRLIKSDILKLIKAKRYQELKKILERYI